MTSRDASDNAVGADRQRERSASAVAGLYAARRILMTGRLTCPSRCSTSTLKDAPGFPATSACGRAQVRAYASNGSVFQHAEQVFGVKCGDHSFGFGASRDCSFLA